MKARILCVLLLAACSDDISFDYSLTWTCLSAEGCERTEEVKLHDRLNISADTFFFGASVLIHRFVAKLPRPYPGCCQR